MARLLILAAQIGAAWTAAAIPLAVWIGRRIATYSRRYTKTPGSTR